jgi:hypothetical protein
MILRGAQSGLKTKIFQWLFLQELDLLTKIPEEGFSN